MATNTDKFIVVGDRVLIKPKTPETQTKSGLYLPPSVQEKEKIQSGYVVKTGPGYAVAPPADADEPWKEPATTPKYIPLQAQVGDLAIYIQNFAHEIEFDDEKYMIVPHSAILMLIRENDIV
ncbi:MAG: co-chaperone GroES family protein [Chloroherpetonaceae bacterium]|nr:co-chaperone GroES family protein [Chloroherpetonaceae bacterium]MDW8437321.1 co-chaperone GroES family protein [Chloroherpetonaceae bacterium]